MHPLELPLPFPYRVSSDLERARRHNTDWLHRMGLLTPGDRTDAYLQHMLAEAVALSYPQLKGPGLDLVVDAFSLIGFLDDLIGSHTGSQESLNNLHDRYVGVMAGNSTREQHEEPLARAWDDIWTRQKQGKSAWWAQYSRARWLDFLAASVEEATAKREGRPPDLPTYTELRRRSIAIHLLLDLAEAGGGFEVPCHAVTSSLVARMIELCGDVVSHVNDLFSLDKEEAAGEMHNLVLVLQRQYQFTRQQAIEDVAGRVGNLLRYFSEALAKVPALRSSLHLDSQQHNDLLRYIDAMISLIRGNYDWSQITLRYRAGEQKAGPITTPATLPGPPRSFRTAT